MRLFINGLAASAGGGLTYLRNVIPELSRRGDCECIVAANPVLGAEFRGMNRVLIAETNPPRPAVQRFWWEQCSLPQVIRRHSADVLLSTGNFALRRSPVPQILLSRNALYTSPDFYRDLCHRGEYGLWLDTKIRGELARRSIAWSDCTVGPSQAFASELQAWTGKTVLTIPHGFDQIAFLKERSELDEPVKQKLEATKGTFRLLFISHYNYYRNFETLFRAIALLKRRMPSRALRLMLTCSLQDYATPGNYRPARAAALIEDLGIANDVIELGAIPYHALHFLYRSADAYVTAAYAESFAHPLVEAMASGLPVIASDISVHREICCEAASYFSRFSPEGLAKAIAGLIEDPLLPEDRRRAGLLRSQSFSWSRHVDELLNVANGLLSAKAESRLAHVIQRKAAAAN